MSDAVATNLIDAPTCAVAVACAHCGLPVPGPLFELGAEHQFCCHGCRTVYHVLRDSGLSAFYEIRAAEDAAPKPARVVADGYVEYDDPAFLAAHNRPAPGGLCVIDLLVEGVHCGACVWLIERLGRIVPGVVSARLDLRRARVRVTWDPTVARLSQIARGLNSLGYAPHPARGGDEEELRQRAERRFLIRVGIAGAASGNAMLLAFALYAGTYSGIEPAYANLLRWASALVGVISVAWPGSIFLRGAVAALRTRTPHIDVPIALGLVVGTVSSIVNTALGRGEIYFDSLTMLVFLLLVARWIQRRQQRRAADSIELLFSLVPTRARVLRDGEFRDCAIESLASGDIVEVRAQESIPVDGVITEGSTEFDEALLTGEARPVRAGVGDEAHAGAISLSGRVLVRATAVGAETRVGRLMKLVEDSLRQKAPIVQAMDRIAGWFVVAVIVLGLGTLATWLTIDASRAAEVTVALLIVACPCALGLATPLALAIGIGRSARRGILIKGGAALEQLARPGTLLLDKTGTITLGRMTLVEWIGDENVKPLVQALEAHASHPIARALSAALPQQAKIAVTEVRQDARGGIVGLVGRRRLTIGAPRFVTDAVRQSELTGIGAGRDSGTSEVGRDSTTSQIEAAEAFPFPSFRHSSPPFAFAEFLRRTAEQGLSPVLIAMDHEIVAAAALGDAIRPDAAESIAALRRLGWRVGILSGDQQTVVSRVAETLGIEPEAARGGVTPEDKLAVVRQLSTKGSVVMVGDGVNDSAALAAAHVGIAVHGGAEASFAAADVYLAHEGLASIVDLMQAARQTVRAIRRNLAASLCYNVAAVTLAACGFITPLIAALLMPISSLTVVTLAVGVRTFGGQRCR